MDEFPFTKSEWGRIDRLANSIVNASLHEDRVLGEVYFEQLRRLLRRLQRKYGKHPILLETEADFTRNVTRQIRLYKAAIKTAVEHRLPTYTIRISIARVLLDELNDVPTAANELQACQAEVAARADEFERSEWHELWKRCEARKSNQ
jgi:hypothetical protein